MRGGSGGGGGTQKSNAENKNQAFGYISLRWKSTQTTPHDLQRSNCIKPQVLLKTVMQCCSTSLLEINDALWSPLWVIQKELAHLLRLV